MSEFTKGKWTADNRGVYIFTHDFDMMICQMRGWAYLKAQGLSDDEAINVQKANARLIAAAPEMYRLLKEELIPISDYGGIVSLSREDKVSRLLALIDGDSDVSKKEPAS